MGVYINMEMPKSGEVIRIYNNGEARRCPVTEQKAFEVGIAVPVSPHGRYTDIPNIYEERLITFTEEVDDFEISI